MKYARMEAKENKEKSTLNIVEKAHAYTYSVNTTQALCLTMLYAYMYWTAIYAQ